jgi:hypothetical protein
VRTLKLTITIRCTPKTGKADQLHNAIWSAIQKHARKGGNVHTSYEYEEDK